jgi:hypothetical protein
MTLANCACLKLDVPVEACLLRFGTAPTTCGESVGITLRGERVIAHYDAAGAIVELELVGNHKLCQSEALADDQPQS